MERGHVSGIPLNAPRNLAEVINFAQGEFLIFGAMMAISLCEVVPLPIAILLAVAATTILGGLVEIVFIRRARDASVLRLIVITIGISILIREAMLHIWNEDVRSLPLFTGNELSTVTILGASMSPQVLWVVGICAAIVGGLTLFFKFTRTGRAMRACSDDRMAARLGGVNAQRMVTLSFMLSAGMPAPRIGRSRTHRQEWTGGRDVFPSAA